jgi:arylsulfatase
MGYKTPNIDRIANEGIMFTDYYAEQSCTAGRASFMLGQSVFRSGLSKVGLPGAKEGINVLDPTIPALLKNQGYATGQFGKNHFGDRDEHLPTNHGFDEFLGNLYHLNAEEEPEDEDYPRGMIMADGRTFDEAFGPRGVLHSYALANGKQKIVDTGPLTKKRMETVDDETAAAAIDFIRRQHKAGKPFFVWWNGTRMHFRTHVSDENRSKADKIAGHHVDEYQAGMIEHDLHIGQFLDLLDELGIANNTIVHYSTDNGPHYNTWPDAGATPFQGEKNSNWEGGWRVPALMRWPGVIKPGSVSNGIVHHMDMLPTFVAAAGDKNIKKKLLKGYNDKAMGRKYKVHLDGYDMTKHLKNPQGTPSPRKEIFYFSDTGDLTALRYGQWKMIFLQQKTMGTLAVWADPWVPLRIPYIFNLRRDPYERAFFTSNNYYDWMIDKFYLAVPAQGYVANFLASFKEYPPRMKPGSFTLDKVMEKLTSPGEH